jgi:hypothetical protein
MEPSLKDMTKCIIAAFLFFWFVIRIKSDPIPELIPGVDHLSSGFDASKMIGVEAAKGKVFDLTKDGYGSVYVVKANGQQTTFSTPALVDVADISRRTENYCEKIVNTFQEFYK